MGNEQNQGWFIDNRGLTAIVFTLFFGWLLSFPFEGQVLYAIASSYALDPRALIFGLMAAHFLGLLLSGLLIRSLQAAKNIVLYCIVYCVASSLLFFFRPSFAWGFLLVASFLAGLCVAAWGFYFRSFTPPGERLRTVADILIYSNMILPLLHQRLSLLLESHVFLLAPPLITRGETSATPVVEPPLLAALTEREHEIAMLLSRGRTYKMIAEELFLSENTIKTHIKNIYSKLGIQRKADLVRLINQKGFSPPR